MTWNVLITGASRGLGSAMAKALWEQGACLFLVARNGEALSTLIASLEPRSGQSAHPFPLDLTVPGAVDQVLESARAHFDHLDVLINNAAVQGPIGPSWENDWTDWRQALELDLFIPVDLARRCAAWMIPQGRGKIICISGGGAASSRPNFSAYSVAKSGLVRFCEILADELRPHGIQVNCIAPGAMDSAMTETVLQAGPENAGSKEYETASKLHARGTGEVTAHAARLAVFLSSPASDGITGKLISAVWDPWEDLADHLDDLQKTDIYTLRRILPKDRGQGWGGS